MTPALTPPHSLQGSRQPQGDPVQLLRNHPALPGANLIAKGMASLADQPGKRGEHTVEALLVALAADRLRDLGLKVPPAADRIREPNIALYAAVCEAGGGHFEYNALLGRLTSFADAAEGLQGRRSRPA